MWVWRFLIPACRLEKRRCHDDNDDDDNSDDGDDDSDDDVAKILANHNACVFAKIIRCDWLAGESNISMHKLVWEFRIKRLMQREINSKFTVG